MEPWLNVVLVGAVVIAAALIMPKKKPESEHSSQSVRNMETALDEFMENMEKDNEQLLQLVSETQQHAKLEAQLKDQRISLLEERCGQLERLLQEAIVRPAVAASHPAHAPAKDAVSDAGARAGSTSEEGLAVSAEPDKLGDSEKTQNPDSIHARYAELFQLYGEGKSVEAIAKRLGMNKGEVQLIIGLSKQEEAAHA
ncbi:hypothetical protein D3P08_15395 [Paenibacillus nanensis]|uniref:DUF2802 domain-containing protein n=1 Tax=Paenibacillus nanensis TaxID=393251 RepID=A0A3A1UTE0_9BACL|nr:hypothetical protein [Paenibacillus nanensis]RIX51798.1 hypothetical protein D3P08_15395 [Paenibacillus nanensis]